MRFFTLTLAALASSAIVPALALPTVPELATRNIDFSAEHSFDIFGSLNAEGCAAFAGACLGANASAIEASAKASLEAWVTASANLTAELKASLKSWCSESIELSVEAAAELSVYVPVAVNIAAKGGLFVSVNGISSVAVDAGVVLDAVFRAELVAFLRTHAHLDAKVKLALEVIANGGVVTVLTAEVKTALLVYLKSSECRLSVHLVAAIKLWIAGSTGVGVVVIGGVSSAAAISASVGATIAAAVDAQGILAASFAHALKIWIATVGIKLDADIKAALELCIAGKSAILLEEKVVIKLTQWLLSEKCLLAAQLKASVLLWLHARVALTETVLVLSAAEIATLTAWFHGGIAASLSAVTKGAIAAAIAGEAVVGVSFAAVAELVAVVYGLVPDVYVSVDIDVIIVEWVSGVSCGCQ